MTYVRKSNQSNIVHKLADLRTFYILCSYFTIHHVQYVKKYSALKVTWTEKEKDKTGQGSHRSSGYWQVWISAHSRIMQNSIYFYTVVYCTIHTNKCTRINRQCKKRYFMVYTTTVDPSTKNIFFSESVLYIYLAGLKVLATPLLIFASFVFLRDV